jgi:acyl dehydratase
MQVGDELAPYAFEVDRSQLRLFAKAIGEMRAEYSDCAAARAAGWRDLPAPPTFAFTIAMNPSTPFDMLDAIGAKLAQVLHGGQAFEYFAPICAGDVISVRRRLVEAFEKKNGALRFFVFEAQLDNEAGETLCIARQTVVVRA